MEDERLCATAEAREPAGADTGLGGFGGLKGTGEWEWGVGRWEVSGANVKYLGEVGSCERTALAFDGSVAEVAPSTGLCTGTEMTSYGGSIMTSE